MADILFQVGLQIYIIGSMLVEGTFSSWVADLYHWLLWLLWLLWLVEGAAQDGVRVFYHWLVSGRDFFKLGWRFFIINLCILITISSLVRRFILLGRSVDLFNVVFRSLSYG